MNNILDIIVSRLLSIQGQSESVAEMNPSSYTYKRSIYKCLRGRRSIDQLNDFPTAMVWLDSPELRYSIGNNTRYGSALIVIHAWVKGDRDTMVERCDDICEDICYAVNSLYYRPDLTEGTNLVELKVVSTSSDEGWLGDFGMVELKVLVTREINNNLDIG